MKLRSYQERFYYLNILTDVLFLSITWISCFFLRFDMAVVQIKKGYDSFDHAIQLLPLLILSYLLVFLSGGSDKKNNFILKESLIDFFPLIKKHVWSFFIFVAMAFFVYEHKYSRVAMILFFLLAPFSLYLGRYFIGKISFLYMSKSKSKKKVILLGSGPSVEKVKAMVAMRLDWKWTNDQNFSNADVIFLVPSANEVLHMSTMYQSIDKTLAEIFLIPYMGEKSFFEPKAVHLGAFHAMALNASGMSDAGMLFKRLFDIVFSLLFISCFFPVFLICGLLVKCTSAGPVFYKQERMGLDGKKFMCLKFRGMYQDAENKTGPVWATANDDRTTPVGKWLRKTSLDEIPQFFNVLKGDMSVVGPRPERPVFVDQFKDNVPGYLLRHKAKAGITGWAQVCGWRGNTSLEKRIECDLWYIQNWTFWLDLKIILLTPFKGLIHPNAY